MEITDTVTIDGELERIFELASVVERWPEILPHYRSVEVLSVEGDSRLVRMHCVRSFGPIQWPCKWRALQRCEPDRGLIHFEHVGGPTKGMRVEWRLRQTAAGVETTIWHAIRSKVPLFGWIYTNLIVGPIFIHAVAGRTLRTIKEIVESSAESGSEPLSPRGEGGWGKRGTSEVAR